MSIEKALQERSNHCCELCSSTQSLTIYKVPTGSKGTIQDSIYICQKCEDQIEKKEFLDTNHWQCLTNSMWSEVAPVQVVAWRLLNRCRQAAWAAEALDMMYLDDETLAWAKQTDDHNQTANDGMHIDSNGNILKEGDNIALIKSLDVKGSTVNAKLGTVVHNIRLVKDNTEQIEGRIDNQMIVILTKYVRKVQ
jgi:protein PhnA